MEHSLVIHPQGLAIWRHTASGIEREAGIDANDKKARTKFQDWLAGARRSITLIADLDDERHAIERLPHASRADRLQLIRRKLAQRFPDAAFTAATPLPADPEDNLVKPVLLSAIPRSASIALWLDVLSEAGMQGRIGAPLLTSVPFLVEHWYRRQSGLPPQGLLLTLGAGGMRQLFFRQCRLAYSRVIPARAATLAGSLPAYRDELAQTLAWLPSQRLAEGTPPILVLAAEPDFPLLRELAPPSGSSMDFIDIARCLGGSADVLSLALRETRQGGTPGHYECPPLRRLRQLTTARRAVWGLTAAVLTAGLAASAAEFSDASRLRHETGQLAVEQQTLQSELEKLRAEATDEPGADFPDNWLDKAEGFIHDEGISPATMLQAVAGLLDKAAWARLEALAWKKQAAQDKGEEASPNKNDPQAPVGAASCRPLEGAPPADGLQNLQAPTTCSALADTPSASIELEISLIGNEAPQSAADRLVSLWQQQRGSPMSAHVNPATARLNLNATLTLPARKKWDKQP